MTDRWLLGFQKTKRFPELLPVSPGLASGSGREREALSPYSGPKRSGVLEHSDPAMRGDAQRVLLSNLNFLDFIQGDFVARTVVKFGRTRRLMRGDGLS